MAGEGSRFQQSGFSKPKPFINVNGKPMIIKVLENLNLPNSKYFLIARKEHLDQEAEIVKKIKTDFNVTFIPINKLTEGTACTILFARKYINNNTPLLIANSDQIVDFEPQKYINDCYERNLDGSILTFIDKSRNPKWSFAKINKNEKVTEVKEKSPISEYATVGIYLYSRGSDFCNAALDMLINNDRTNNEFYTCPTYNYAIREGLDIGIYNIDHKLMHGLGTPEDLNNYLSSKNRVS